MLRHLEYLFLIAFFHTACLAQSAPQDTATLSWIDEVLQGPERQLKNYQFDPETSIESRVKKPNEHLLAYIRSFEHATEAAQPPTGSELQTVIDAIKMLPPLSQRIMDERVIEISFVKNLGYNGWTDWVVDENGAIYCVMVFDQKALDFTLSEWLEGRINSCFKNDKSGIEIEIDCGNRYSGFLGILLHEATHVVDYIENITPFVEPSIFELGLKYGHQFRESYPFVKGIWYGNASPAEEYNYPLRDSLTFYRPVDQRKLYLKEAALVINQLPSTPFVSLYASTSWAEDLAEISTFYHLTQKLKQPYTITVIEGGESTVYHPMENPLVDARFPVIERFYQTEP
ncbi:MAG: hypothetical protein JSU77_09090 [Fidelibacterota bacterium]|nr:MAG: hypothetical protein JSU77_09090 [Candidatus Neomarinimicrobiota bacterium]